MSPVISEGAKNFSPVLLPIPHSSILDLRSSILNFPVIRNPQSAIRNGFTLLEVLVAMAVLAVALVSLLGLFNRSLLLTIRAQRVNTAMLLAQELLTRTQLEGAEATRRMSGDFAVSHPGQYPEFRWNRRVRSAPVEGLWEVWIRVAWGPGEYDGCELTLFTPMDEQ